MKTIPKLTCLCVPYQDGCIYEHSLMFLARVHIQMQTCVCGCRLMSLVIALRSTSCCFGPNPSCWYGSNSVFPLNQMKKVKRTTPFPQPEGSARIARTFCLLIQDNKGATPAQVIITTLAPVWNNNDA